MSKKYRLFREFPGSPDYGTVVLKGNSSDPNPELYADRKNIFFFTVEQVENYPEFWEEIKEALFITNDGVEIFEQVRLWTVIKDSLFLFTSTPTELCEQYIYFAEKENAEKYIIDNEKKYSLNDMVNVVNHWACIKNITSDNILKYLEKDK